jgi:hypothetical protein
VDNRQRVAINTSRILLENESRGFEEKLAKLVEEVEKEAYKFVYKMKVADPEMFPYHDGEEPEEIIESEDEDFGEIEEESEQKTEEKTEA